MLEDNIDQARIRLSPDGRMSRADAAIFLGLKPKTLSMWAWERRGPKIVRIGGRCFYRLDDLRRFVDGEAA